MYWTRKLYVASSLQQSSSYKLERSAPKTDTTTPQVRLKISSAV